MIRAALILVLVAVAACARPADHVVTAPALRAAVAGIDPATVPADRWAAFERGELWLGASELEVYLARGRPILWWSTQHPTASGWCKVLAHASLRDPSVADTAVTACGGAVVQVAPIAPALPCWRLAEVAPRIVAAAAYFDQQPIETQWHVVAGILKRGQSARDVAIAFGPPHNSGLDEREDGTRADQQVFLDASGDAYGLRVTFVGDRVVAWRIPPERTLTPEAEQRRLQAMERRLTSKLEDLERRSIRQHAETVSLFKQVMTNQDSMMAALTQPPPTPARVDEPARRPPGDRGDSPPAPRPPGSKPPIQVEVVRKQIPWGRGCREGSDDCAPGSCLRADGDRPICSKLCTAGSEDCAPGYRCGFETTVNKAGHVLQNGLRMCRPTR